MIFRDVAICKQGQLRTDMNKTNWNTDMPFEIYRDH